MFAVQSRLASAPPQTRPQQLNRGSYRLGATHASRLRLRAEKEDAEREIESLFEKELRRRGIDASDPSTSKGPPEQQRTATRPAPGFRGAPSEDDYDVPPQLARSRALQSEGLEGLIPRGSELLKLGLSFFLAFIPFILVISLAFGGIYAVFGDSFVHGGAPSSGPPPYIDPDMLLAEPTADPMVPLDLR